METELRFGVLGPVRAWDNDVELDLGSPQQRAVLAILLLSQGRQVSRDTLIDAIWGDSPPRSAAGTVRTYVSRLRRCLDPVTGCQAAALLKTVGDGYAIETGAVTVDVEQFTQRVRQARQSRARGDLSLAVSQLGEALGLWRGLPLAGVQGRYADSQRTRLLELHLAAAEDRLSMQIETGGHLAAIAELRSLLDQHPLREKLSELLMLALYRAGRQADALGVFDDLRRLLRDELGIDPGPGLREMHQRILRADERLLPLAGQLADGQAAPPPRRPTGPPPPLPLPPADPDVTGRTDTLAAVVAALRDGSAMPVAAITGMPGIGKTALAIQAAHAARAAFPDGQLYAELRGGDGTAADPGQIRQRLRRAIADAPGHRVLVLLDGVDDAAQARLLLDGLRGCAVIITTQRRMTDLPGARWFELRPLPPDEARQLLIRLIGPERVAADRAGADWMVALTVGQPSVIRIAAARLISRPAWKISAMARQLEEEFTQPERVFPDCSQVEVPFELAYQRLTAEQAFVFRQAATAEGPEVSVAAVAARTRMPEHQAFTALESLADAHLVETDVFGSYRYDPLVRLFGRRKAIAEDGQRTGRDTR